MTSHKTSRRWDRIGRLGRTKALKKRDLGNTKSRLIKHEDDKDMNDAIRSITVEAVPLTAEQQRLLDENLFDLLYGLLRFIGKKI